MDADRLRRRLAGALGEPPDLSPAVQRLEARLASLEGEPAPAARSATSMAVVAGVLAVAVTASLLGMRALTARPAPPAVTSTAASAGCRLPLVETTSGYPSTTLAAGFLTVATGTFRRDASAPAAATTYDPVARRWLPVRPPAIAPDHSAYAYVVNQDQAFQLHVEQIATGADRVVWSGPGGIDLPIRWTDSGIEVTTVPAGGGLTHGWVIPPAGGQPRPGTVEPDTAEFVRTNVGTTFPTVDYEATFQGMSIVRDEQAGTYLLGPDGQRIVISTVSADFDPSTFVADADRLWAVNADGSALWLWTRKDGLQRLPLNMAPDASATYWVAGPCV